MSNKIKYAVTDAKKMHLAFLYHNGKKVYVLVFEKEKLNCGTEWLSGRSDNVSFTSCLHFADKLFQKEENYYNNSIQVPTTRDIEKAIKQGFTWIVTHSEIPFSFRNLLVDYDYVKLTVTVNQNSGCLLIESPIIYAEQLDPELQPPHKNIMKRLKEKDF